MNQLEEFARSILVGFAVTSIGTGAALAVLYVVHAIGGL
jgi:hypothetical protein